VRQLLDESDPIVRDQARRRFQGIADQSRRAIITRTSDPRLQLLFEFRVAPNISLIAVAPPSSTGTVIAGLNDEQLGRPFDFSRFSELKTNLDHVVIDDDDGLDEGSLSTFAPVRDEQNRTIAIVEIRSDATLFRHVDLVVVALAGGVFLLAFSLSIGGARLLAARINRPVATLHQGMRRLASGDLDITLTVTASGDEFDELVADFNTMAEGLRERDSMQRAIVVASEIQHRLLPAEAPGIPGFDVAAVIRYSDHAGGDYYDFIELPAAGPDPARWYITIGDVVGHGVGASLLMAWTRATVRALARELGDDTAGLLARLNRDLHSDTDPGKFLTLFCGLIDPSKRTLRWASAGHEPGLVLRAGSDRPEQLLATGPPMGVLENGSWEAGQPLSLAPGDLLVLVTDGITEAQAPDGARYQRERLSQVAQRHAAESADRICQAVLSDVAEFVGARSPTDDITIVVIKTCEPLSGTGPQQAGRSAGR
jgi:serine phosphatase RsbU (regulator of sigma subunit)